MKQILFALCMSFAHISAAQLITTEPTFPSVNGSVEIYFNSNEGNQALKDYEGDIYAHAGLITSESTSGSDWKYVIADWDENTDKAKLERVENNLYKLTISPDILSFYGVNAGELVKELAFVFRSEDGSKVGKTSDDGDMYVTVYEEALSDSIMEPATDIMVKSGDTITIKAASSFSDSLLLFHDSERIFTTTGNEITTSIIATGTGKHWVLAEAKSGSEIVYDSIFYFIRQDAPVTELPLGLIKGVNYESDTKVTLVLNAPEKEFTYLIGDFNNWDFTLAPAMSESTFGQVSTTAWIMNKTPDGEYHWITLENLTPNAEYAYQYLVGGSVRIADPYTEKVLDPWNDKYIDEETYPNLKEYPHDLTTEPVSVFQTAQKQFEWEASDFKMPAVEDMVIYEVLIRDFVATHSYKTIADSIGYLKRLGVNVLELMPVNEFEGNSSWGYNPSFYFAPDKYYGPKDELKRLVDACHKQGISVVIDLVLNHSFGQSPLVRMYFENGKPAANNPWYNVDHNFTNPDAHWGYDFNHESVYTQELVDSVNAFWMSEYQVDGFRFDFTKGFGNNIKDGSDEWGSLYDTDRVRLLKRMADEIWKRNPDAFISFEHLAENKEEKELANYGINMWGNMNHAYNEGAMGYTESGKSDISWISYQNRNWDNPNVVGYMESHDEERLMFKNLEYGNAEGGYNVKDLNIALQRNELGAAFFFTIPGPKMIWQFGELGYDISIDYNGRTGEKPIKWDYYEVANRKKLYDVYAALTKLKVEEPAFKTTDYELDVHNGIKQIQLNHTDMNVLVLGNFEVSSQTVEASFQETGWWYEYFSGDSVMVSEASVAFEFNAGEYRLYTTKRLAKPDIELGVVDKSKAGVIHSMNIYPNPVLNKLYLDDNYSRIEIFTISGQLVFYRLNDVQNVVSVGSLEKGLYLIKSIDTEGSTYVSKFLKE